MSPHSSLEQQVTAQLKEGDILFISINSFLYKQVAQGTGSWCSHVGFAIQEKGKWYVLESAVPTVRKTPLHKFLKRTCNNEFALRRLPSELTTTQVLKLKSAADKRMGRWYHLGFNFDSTRQFCSKFVHQVFKDALNISVGKVETLQELIETNPQANLTFWRAWYLGFIPWKRRTITPSSLLVDPQLDTIICTI
jgi:hypothetical protein